MLNQTDVSAPTINILMILTVETLLKNGLQWRQTGYFFFPMKEIGNEDILQQQIETKKR